MRAAARLAGRWRAAGLAAICLCASCGYSLVGRGGSFPEGVQTVAVVPFKNGTTRYGLESEISSVFVQELMNTGKVKIAAEGEADALLSGTVNGYANNAIAYNAAREIIERRVTVTARVEFRVKGKDEPYFSETGLTGKSEYPVVNNLVRDTEMEKEAIHKAFVDLASNVISRIVEGF